MSKTTHSESPIILAQDVWKSYEDGAIQVLNGVSLSIARGESAALCGPSGCGKSTLLHLLGGLDFPTRGTLTVNGRALSEKMNTVQFLRREVGFVFQLHNLIPDLSLRENCLIPSIAAGVPHAQAMERLRYLASRTGLEHRMEQRIQKLSGGERQRTALCRALMNRPAVLLADEPTGSLDQRTSEQIFELLTELVAQDGITLVMATHDLGLARRCDHLMEMRDGKLCA